MVASWYDWGIRFLPVLGTSTPYFTLHTSASRLNVSQYLNRKRQERSVTAGLTLEADGNLDCR